MGDSLQVVTTDSWDDNLPSGCVQPLPAPHGVPAAECFDNFGTWNQTRPGVFDGGYAFNDLPRGRYIVRVDPPPFYEIQKEEDKNVEGGDVYLPLAPCVGALHMIPPAGPSTPLCDMKQVALSDGQNGATDFSIFTQVPKAARGVGFVNNDLTAEFNVGVADLRREGRARVAADLGAGLGRATRSTASTPTSGVATTSS